MATFISDSNLHRGLMGSPEKRLDYAPDGTLWLLLVTGSTARFFRSTNGGTTWTHSASSDLNVAQTQTLPSFFIDADGYAHMVWALFSRDPQIVRYARGKPTSGGGWSWSTKDITPASGRLRVDSDVVAFRVGTGWSVWVSYSIIGNSGVQVARLSVSSNGTVTVDSTADGPVQGITDRMHGSLSFHHTGDGKTPAATPHVYLTTSPGETTGQVRFHRARRDGSLWIWESPVTADSSATVDHTAFVSVFDGTRVLVAYRDSATALGFVEWTPGAPETVTTRNPPALPGGVSDPNGVSLAVDPATSDAYLAFHDLTDGDIRWSKLTRAGTPAWGAWAVAATRLGNPYDGKVQLARHVKGSTVDMVYGDPLTAGGDDFKIYYQTLASLTRAPTAPTLLSPASGASLDLNAGATFTWRFNGADAGDKQTAWQFRRVVGATTEYWNQAGQTWSTTVFWNSGDAKEATFASGKWPAATYSWSVVTRGSTGTDSPRSALRTVVSTVAPVVVVTAPGSLHYGETTPTVTWTYTSTKAQRSYEVRIVPTAAGIDPADPGPSTWTSGLVTSATARAHRVVETLQTNVSYRAYVRATDSDGTASSWSYSEFTLVLEPPAGPLVELRDDVHDVTGVPRVRLDLMARSNFLGALQAIGQDGWEADNANTTVAAQAQDLDNQLEASLHLTSVAAGDVQARTVLGSPPVAPPGEVQPLGPLDFPVLGGREYSALAGFRTAGVLRAARVGIRWYADDDATTDTVLGESWSPQVNTSTTGYTPASITALAPVAAKRGRMLVQVLGATAAGEVFYVNGLSLHPGVSTAWQAGGYSDTQVLAVERSLDDGLTWATLLDRVKPSLYQTAVAYDRLAPFSLDVSYRVTTLVDIGGGASLSSQAGPISTIALRFDSWAIRDPNDPDGEMVALVVGHDSSDDDDVTVYWPAGRAYPVVDSDDAKSLEGTLTLYVPGPDVARAVDLLRRGVPMVVQSPAGALMSVRFRRREYEPETGRSRTIVASYVQVG